MKNFSQNKQYGEISDKSRYFGRNEALTCYAVSCFVYVFISLVISRIKNSLNVQDGTIGYWLCYVLISVSIGCIALIFAKVQKKDFFESTTLSKAPGLWHVLWGSVIVVGLIFFMNPIVVWVCDVIENVGLPRPKVNIELDIVPLLLVATFLPAICEEILFRSIISNGLLRTSNNKIAATILSGFLFALFHANPAQTIHQFVFGCFLVIVAYRSGSVWTSIILHFINNLVSVIGEFCFPAWLVTGWMPCLCGFVLSVLGVVGYFMFTKNQAMQCIKEKVGFLPVALSTVAVVVFIILWVATLIAG